MTTTFSLVVLFALVQILRRQALFGRSPRFPRSPLDPPSRSRMALFCGGALFLSFIATRSAGVAALAIVALSFGLMPALAVVTVPLGLPRLAFALDRFGGGTGRPLERPASAAFVAACALLRRPHDRDARWVESYLASCVELGTSGAAALALVARSRGDTAQSLALFGVLDAMGKDFVLPAALRVARDHLAVAALGRGDWKHIVALRERPGRSRLTGLLGTLGRVVVPVESAPPSVSAPSDGEVWLAWLLAPRRGTTWPLVRDTLKRRPSAPAPPPSVGPGLAACASLLARDPVCVGAADVAAAVRSLDELRASPAFIAGLARRALASGSAIDAGATADAVLRDAESDIAAAILEARWPATWIPLGASGDAVRARVADERLRIAESLVGELARRSAERIDLPEADEWRAWADARRALDELRSDEVPAETLFATVFLPLTNYSARLVNVRSIRILAGDVFRYVCNCAYAAQAKHAYDLVDRNVRAVRAHALPRQVIPSGDPVGDPARSVDLRSQWFAQTCVVSGLATIGVVGCYMLASAAMRFALIGIVILASWLFYFVRHAFVDCVRNDDGLVMQTGRRRYVAPLKDIRAIDAGPGALVRIRLRRQPRWLPRFVFTVAASGAAARADVQRVREAMQGARDRAVTASNGGLA